MRLNTVLLLSSQLYQTIRQQGHCSLITDINFMLRPNDWDLFLQINEKVKSLRYVEREKMGQILCEWLESLKRWSDDDLPPASKGDLLRRLLSR